MFQQPKIIENFQQRYGWAELLIFTLLTALSVYTEQVSIFYVIYLFWWNELINNVVDFIYKRFQKKKDSARVESAFGGFFLLFIYFVFIVVFFGLIANWHNEKLMYVNVRILFFKNLFFNLNLLYIAVMRVYMLVNKQIEPQQSHIFTPNMIVLHISIIFGAMMMFFVVKKYPNTFSPDNLWGSVLIILPFLLLRYFVQLSQLKKR